VEIALAGCIRALHDRRFLYARLELCYYVVNATEGAMQLGCCVYVCIGDDSTVLLDLHTGGCDPEGVADLLRTLAERFN